MKFIFIGLALLFVSVSAFARGGTMVGGGDESTCTLEIATARAHKIANAMAKVNGLKKVSPYDFAPVENGSVYEISRAFDQGLSVPTFKVSVQKESCFVESVSYSNGEG